MPPPPPSNHIDRDVSIGWNYTVRGGRSGGAVRGGRGEGAIRGGRGGAGPSTYVGQEGQRLSNIANTDDVVAPNCVSLEVKRAIVKGLTGLTSQERAAVAAGARIKAQELNDLSNVNKKDTVKNSLVLTRLEKQMGVYLQGKGKIGNDVPDHPAVLKREADRKAREEEKKAAAEEEKKKRKEEEEKEKAEQTQKKQAEKEQEQQENAANADDEGAEASKGKVGSGKDDGVAVTTKAVAATRIEDDNEEDE